MKSVPPPDTSKEPAVRQLFKKLGLEVKPGEELPTMLEVTASNLLYVHGIGELTTEIWSEVQRLRKDVNHQSFALEKLDALTDKLDRFEKRLDKFDREWKTLFDTTQELVNHTAVMTERMVHLQAEIKGVPAPYPDKIFSSPEDQARVVAHKADVLNPASSDAPSSGLATRIDRKH